MNIDEARRLVAMLSPTQNEGLALAHDRYTHFTGVFSGDVSDAQVARDRLDYSHLLKGTANGHPWLSDDRCAEFMAAVSGLPVDWCSAWHEVDFCDTHGEDFIGKQLKLLQSRASEEYLAAFALVVG
ncbi:MAG: hypothetical protein H7255_16390 [Ramlibacter sp.]|nr:hypothetical protein [Ramlibacter sp.]